MYNHPYVVEPVPGEPFDFRVVQADDFGSFWNRGEAQQTLDHVQARAQTTNTLVVLFIHGWHNNADPANANLRGFRAALGKMHGLLDTPERRALRERTTGQADFALVGIYVGWRGRSLPGWLDYATFWGRKNAAERTGEGDVSEFIQRLQHLYLRTNEFDVRRHGPSKPFLGLVAIGHSFGAQVLWKSIASRLEEPLIAQAHVLSDALDPTDRSQRDREGLPIDGLGDLNVLLNPATEAYQYARVDALYRQLQYPSAQTPQLVVFSADNDRARRFYFPIGRALGSPFRPSFRDRHDGYQGQLWGHALGELDEQQTHTLRRPAPGTTPADSLTDADYSNAQRIRAFDFTDRLVLGGLVLEPSRPVAASAGRVPYSPVLSVKSLDGIIDGHNGIFLDDFNRFLLNFVAYIEAKRLMLRRERLLTGSHAQPLVQAADALRAD